MKIKNRLYLNTYLMIILVLGIGIIFFVMTKAINEAVARHEHFFKLSQGFFELNIITSDYLIHQGNQSLNQWYSKHNSIKQFLHQKIILEQLKKFDSESILNDLAVTENVFAKLVSTFQQTPTSPSSHLLQKHLIGQIQTGLHKINFQVGELVFQSQKLVVMAQNNSIWAIVWITFCIVIIIGINSYILKNSIVQPINKLQMGAVLVGKGNLEHRLGLSSNNEIGELSSSFDEMTEKLQQSKSEAQQLNQQLISNITQLERSNKELDDFVFIASHDLKEPLRSIHLQTDFLQMGYSEQLDEKGKHYLQRLKVQTLWMTQMIDTLYQYSTMERTSLKYQLVDLDQTLNRVLKALNDSLTLHQIEIRRHRPLPSIKCDPDRIYEVLYQLISNAITYNDKPQKWIEIGVQPSSNPSIFFVKDNGIGIQEEHFDSIFRIFKRLHRRGNLETERGVGLTFSKKIVERHGGKLWVESKLGEGSTFLFTL